MPVRRLVTSASEELAMHFSADSADAFVLLKQGQPNRQSPLLDKMRADYLDVNSRSTNGRHSMLYKRRRLAGPSTR